MYYEVYHRAEGDEELIGVFFTEQEAREFAAETRQRRADGIVSTVLFTAHGIQRTLEQLPADAAAGQRSPRPDKRPTVPVVSTCPRCDTVTDVYKFRSRNVIGKLLRSVVEERVVTPSEVLWDYALLRHLQKDNLLLSHGVGVVARIQRQDGTESLKACQDRLYRLIDATLDAAKAGFHIPDAEVKALLAARANALFAIVQGPESDARKLQELTRIVARITGQHADWAGKLGAFTGILATARDWAVVLLDAFVAEIIELPAAREELLGIRKHGAKSIRPLVDVLTNEVPDRGKDGPPPALATLAAVANHDGTHETRARLWGWLRLQMHDERKLVHWERQDEITEYRVLLARLIGLEDFLTQGPGLGLTEALAKVLAEDGERADIAETLAFITAALPSQRERLAYLAALLREGPGADWRKAIEASLWTVMEGLQAVPGDVAAHRFRGRDAGRAAFLDACLGLLRAAELEPRLRQFSLHVLTQLAADRGPSDADIDRLWGDMVGTDDWDIKRPRGL